MGTEETLGEIQKSLEPKPVPASSDAQLRERLGVATEELKNVKVQIDELCSVVDELMLKPIHEIEVAVRVRVEYYRKMNARLDEAKTP